MRSSEVLVVTETGSGRISTDAIHSEMDAVRALMTLGHKVGGPIAMFARRKNGELAELEGASPATEIFNELGGGVDDESR